MSRESDYGRPVEWLEVIRKKDGGVGTSKRGGVFKLWGQDSDHNGTYTTAIIELNTGWIEIIAAGQVRFADVFTDADDESG